jgi:hypothetical protein
VSTEIVIDERRLYEIYARKLVEKITDDPKKRKGAMTVIMAAFDDGVALGRHGKVTVEIEEQ